MIYGNPAITMARSWAVRAALELARGKIHRAIEDSAEIGNHEWVDLSDLSESDRESRHRRRPENVLGVCMHVTGVRGGFGASGGDIRWAERQLSDGTVYTRGVIGDSDEIMVRKVAIRRRYLGVGGRGRGLPYHRVVSASGECLILHHLAEKTYHGHRANSAFEGLGIDGLFTDSISPMVADLSRWALREMFVSRLHLERYRKVTAHRCYSMGRLADPGAVVWREVVRPVVESMNGVIKIHDVERGGKKIGNEW